MARGYTNEEILAMQKDAIRRVNEMRRMSEEKLRQTAPPEQQPPSPPPPSPKEDEKPLPVQEQEISAPTEHSSGGLTAILQSFGGDRETMLLLALLFLLIKEEADTSLILALVYILL